MRFSWRFHILQIRFQNIIARMFLSILSCWHCMFILNRYSRFQSVGNITLHFPDNFGGDTTQIHYIGLKGEATQVLFQVQTLDSFFPFSFSWFNFNFMQLKRDVVATIVYELMPNPSDHKWVTNLFQDKLARGYLTCLLDIGHMYCIYIIDISIAWILYHLRLGHRFAL